MNQCSIPWAFWIEDFVWFGFSYCELVLWGRSKSGDRFPPEVGFVLASTNRNLILNKVQVWLCLPWAPCAAAACVSGLENGPVCFTESQNWWVWKNPLRVSSPTSAWASPYQLSHIWSFLKHLQDQVTPPSPLAAPSNIWSVIPWRNCAWCPSLGPFPLVLSLVPREQRPTLASPEAPFRQP